jgi:hypothetical protein
MLAESAPEHNEWERPPIWHALSTRSVFFYVWFNIYLSQHVNLVRVHRSETKNRKSFIVWKRTAIFLDEHMATALINTLTCWTIWVQLGICDLKLQKLCRYYHVMKGNV